MKKYEVMFIIRPEVTDEVKNQVVETISNVFTSNESTVDKVTEMGMRELAYEIAGCTKGIYILLNVTATPAAVKEFDRIANINEQIIRHICVAE